MAEPSERDWEMARQIEERIIFRTKEGLASVGLAHVNPVPTKLDEYLALFIAQARAEGAAKMLEQRAQCLENKAAECEDGPQMTEATRPYGTECRHGRHLCAECDADYITAIGATEKLESGWYLLCAGQKYKCARLPEDDWLLQGQGWTLGPAIADLLRTAAWAGHARHLLTPAQLAMIEAELAREEKDGDA